VKQNKLTKKQAKKTIKKIDKHRPTLSWNESHSHHFLGISRWT